jgi:uncharacterized membrane protein
MDVRGRTVSKPFGEIIHEVKKNPWRLGIIYADPEDRRLIVRQRTGLGWTLNFGRPLSWAILAVTVGIGIWRRRQRNDAD